MPLENTLLGIAGILVGIAIFIKTSELWGALVPVVIGIALILFSKGAGKIEQRKDINK